VRNNDRDDVYLHLWFTGIRKVFLGRYSKGHLTMDKTGLHVFTKEVEQRTNRDGLNREVNVLDILPPSLAGLFQQPK